MLTSAPDGPSLMRRATRGPAETGSRVHADDPDVSALFAGLDTAAAIVLAVSGGPDSMALLHLAARWAAGLVAPPRLHVASIDHGLRPASREECALVGAAAAALGLRFAQLAWLGPKPTTRIQERARETRYALLAAHARAIGATHILTAHHADDQAETILMRLARGSGVSGLAGMRREIGLAPGVTLVRPLLRLLKRDLVALCRRAGQTYVEDPSNHDPAYARSRLRAQATATARLGLDAAGLGRLARRMARADAALEAETDRLEHSLGPIRERGRYQIDLRQAAIADEFLLRLLRRAIGHVSMRDRPIRLDRLEALGEALQGAIRSHLPHRATLGGARLVLDRDTLLDVTREPPRRRGRLGASESPLPSPSLRPN